jgi:surface protein
MRATFSHCAYKALSFDIGDLSNWDVSNVTKMGGTSSINNDVLNHYGMFGSLGHNAQEFKLKGIEHWDVSNVTDMAGMFSSAGYSASSFDVGDLSNWDVSNVTDLNGMFLQTALNAETVKIGDLSKWNTENCTSMIWTFSCFAQDAVYSLDLSDWNVAKVTNHLDFNLNVKNQIISPWD